jgi:hypothetical protein
MDAVGEQAGAEGLRGCVKRGGLIDAPMDEPQLRPEQIPDSCQHCQTDNRGYYSVPVK